MGAGIPLVQAAATIRAPGRARRGASGSLNPQSAIAGPNTARGAEFFGAWARARSVDGQVPRTGSLRTASGPEGSSAKECLAGAADKPDPSKRRGRLPGERFDGGARDRALGNLELFERASSVGSCHRPARPDLSGCLLRRTPRGRRRGGGDRREECRRRAACAEREGNAVGGVRARNTSCRVDPSRTGEVARRQRRDGDVRRHGQGLPHRRRRSGRAGAERRRSHARSRPQARLHLADRPPGHRPADDGARLAGTGAGRERAADRRLLALEQLEPEYPAPARPAGRERPAEHAERDPRRLSAEQRPPAGRAGAGRREGARRRVVRLPYRDGCLRVVSGRQDVDGTRP